MKVIFYWGVLVPAGALLRGWDSWRQLTARESYWRTPRRSVQPIVQVVRPDWLSRGDDVATARD